MPRSSYQRNYYLQHREKALLRAKKWREENPEAIKLYKREYYKKYRSEIVPKRKIYREKNKEAISLHSREYRKENHDSVIAREKNYRQEHKEIILQRRKRKYKDNIQFRLGVLLRNRLGDALNGRVKKGSAVRDLGCTLTELKFYLEGKFKDGMTWENYCKWHIDHEIPLALFDLTNREQFKRACHYTNLQPLWALDNFKKSAKLISTPNVHEHNNY